MSASRKTFDLVGRRFQVTKPLFGGWNTPYGLPTGAVLEVIKVTSDGPNGIEARPIGNDRSVYCFDALYVSKRLIKEESDGQVK